MLWAVLESVQVQTAGGEMGDVPSTALTGKTPTWRHVAFMLLRNEEGESTMRGRGFKRASNSQKGIHRNSSHLHIGMNILGGGGGEMSVFLPIS